MRDSMKRRPLNRLSITLGLILSLVMLAMPLSRTITTATASGDRPETRVQQDKNTGAAKSLAGNREATARRAPVGMRNARALTAADTAINPEPSFTNYVEEIESNNTAATAQPMTGDSIRVKGNIQPTGDVDFYAFTADAGDRVYAATMTNFTSASGDSVLDLIATNGTTVLETDDEDGSFTPNASSIAGKVIPTTGTYYLRVIQFNSTSQIRPYYLYLRVQKGTPPSELEPNNGDDGVNLLPPSGWVSGAIQAAGDEDFYAFDLKAGDTIYASLDADPERDGTTWNPVLSLGLFNDFLINIDDTNTTSPNSEAYFMTVKTTDTYFLEVSSSVAAAGGPTLTYHLSVSVHPASDRKCTTYTNTTPVVIPTGPGLVTSTINIPDSRRISNLQVSMNVQHTSIPDLDVVLTSPAGNDIILFTDQGIAGATGSGLDEIDMTVDDEAGVPINSMPILFDMILQPQNTRGRLNWLKGENSAGTWTLKVYDDTATNGGTLNSWGITICEDPPISCPAQLQQTIYSSDFETDTGNFTHSGTADEWERGLPSGSSAPITSCNSGTNCWKTDLDNTYNVSSSQDLLSPSIDLTGVKGRQIKVSWAQKYQIDNATSDRAFVDVREVGNPTNSRRLWEWTDTAMQAATGVGNPAVPTAESAGWGIMEYDISQFGGKNVELRFHLDSNTTVQLSGLAIDDVSVTACRLPSRGDFNGNGPTDLSVFRPNDPILGSATWYIYANGVVTQQEFGASTDKPVPADYDGDGDVDIAVFRPNDDGLGNSAFYVSKGSAQNFDKYLWGVNGDIPVPGDYDGDGKTDFAVFRPADGYWYIHRSSDNGLTARPWGLSTDKPVQADYDGDGKTDIAVFRSGSWYIIQSFTNTFRFVSWGAGTDTPVTGDYDGDRQFDVAVYRPSDGYWYILQSTTKAIRAIQWGTAGDIPVPGDYDGDRKFDTVFFRQSDGTWNILRSSNGAYTAAAWGQAGDTPAPRGGVVPD